MKFVVFIVPLLLATVACQGEPERACNRVRFGWPEFQLDPSADTSDAEGIQLAFDVRSDLEANTQASLYLRIGDEEEQTLLAEAITTHDGLLSFDSATVPLGGIVLIVDARDECGTHRTGRRLYVWDGLGFPGCELVLAHSPQEPTDGSIPVLGPEHDEDSDLAGMQVRVLIEAGRPDMDVSLFARDRERDESQEFFRQSDTNGRAEMLVTLPQGEQALRAVCYWEPQELRPSSATHVFLVE